jgi:surface protein
MKHIFTISLCFLALSLSAQETISYPYNPDEDVNGLIASPDLLSLLAGYGEVFSPGEILIDGVSLLEVIQDLQNQINNNTLPDGTLIGDLLIWNGTAWIPESSTVYIISDDNIHAAVDLWFLNEDVAEATYGHISEWDVSSVTDMNNMFGGATSFNGDLSSWDVSSVTDMYNMFGGATSFNGDLSSWDVSSVTNMGHMFSNATSFNGDLSSWEVSNVNYMEAMFSNATSFNGDISSWDVSSAWSMSEMFTNASSFNGDISSWEVSNVNYMEAMFYQASSFNGDLSSWDVSSACCMHEMFHSTALSEENKCLIHTSFSSNSAWPYDWSGLCD